jgi:predicted MFS family arabinose efflux permease
MDDRTARPDRNPSPGPQAASPDDSEDRSLFRALASRNYRLFFSGQAVSLTGLWMQRVAMGWLVYRLTRSPFALGAVDFAASLPIFLLSPLAGNWLEGRDLRRAFFVCQALCMSQALLLALLTWTDRVSYAWVLSICLFLGLVDSFEMPVRQSFVVQLVERKEDLGNALALNSTLFNVARLIGPTAAGWAIAQVGEETCFFLNGLAYGATLWALTSMRLPSRPAVGTRRGGSPWRGLREGWAHASFPPIRLTLGIVAAFSFVGFSYLILMPAVARDVLHGDSRTMGWLLAANGVGALAGALSLAARRSPVGLERVVPLSCVAFGLAVGGFSLARSLALAAPLLAVAGFFMVRTTVAGNTFIQSLVDDDKRSRVMSLYVTAIMGLSPFGSLVTGGAARTLGVPATLLLTGLFCTLSGGYFVRRFRAYRPLIRESFRRKGYSLREPLR